MTGRRSRAARTSGRRHVARQSPSERRRLEIARIIRSEHVSKQELLVSLLAERGWPVTQATVSRDLAALGIERTMDAHGARYTLPASTPARAAFDPLLPAVRQVSHNGYLVAIAVEPTAVAPLAAQLPTSGIPGLLGVFAGEGVVFAVPNTPRGAAQLAQRLRDLLLGALEPHR